MRDDQKDDKQELESLIRKFEDIINNFLDDNLPAIINRALSGIDGWSKLPDELKEHLLAFGVTNYAYYIVNKKVNESRMDDISPDNGDEAQNDIQDGGE